MKLQCYCRALIVDQADELPHKGHLLPDQQWLALFDTIDREVIDPLAQRQISSDDAARQVRQIIGRATCLMWQCRECGRLYIDDLAHEVHCFQPQNGHTSREILRGRST